MGELATVVIVRSSAAQQLMVISITKTELQACVVSVTRQPPHENVKAADDTVEFAVYIENAN
jgi:hypothetical protein